MAQRIILAKIGLDGHDRGVKVVARGLRDAGFHVIYAGLWQPLEAVVQAVLDEDADWLGISILSGAHLTLLPLLIEQLHAKGLEHVRVLVGGIIPSQDLPRLHAMGVAAVFGPGTTIAEIVELMRNLTHANNLDDLFARFRQKDRLALSRLLTLASRGESLDAIRAGLNYDAQPRQGRVIGVSGSGGVGKSSLIGRMIESLRTHGETVAVLCCDPESPLTGGALLGDRVRIGKTAEDTGVFIRSLATPSGSQAVASNLDVLIALFLAYGFQTVILETVGAGQGDTAVHGLVDIVVVLLQPEAGDELQWEKAGLLEVADVVVIHKSDLPGARRVAAQVREQLNLPGCREVPVLMASASRGEGLKDLWETIRQLPQRSA